MGSPACAAVYAESRQERLYIQLQTSCDQIPNTAGTATVAAGDACRFIGMNLNNQPEMFQRPDKTGTRSIQKGIKGRKFASWDVRMSLAGSGVAGTKPDCDAILEAAFGAAGVVDPGVDVTYSLADAVKYLALWSFRSPAGLEQRCAYGSVVEELTVTLGDNIAELQARGSSTFVVNSTTFADAGLPTEEKGGLTTFPSEPANPVTAGDAVVGFTGSVVADGNTMDCIQTATIRLNTGLQSIRNTFGSFYATGANGGERNVGVSFTCYDQDSTAVENLKRKALNKEPIDIVLTIGTVAGNIWKWTLKNVQLEAPTYEDGDIRFSLNFGESMAHASSLALRDELVLEIS